MQICTVKYVAFWREDAFSFKFLSSSQTRFVQPQHSAKIVPCAFRNSAYLMFIRLTVVELSHYHHVQLVSYKPVCQISLSSLGSLRASGVSTLRVPVCSSALGRYVPSVCLFFFTTQNTYSRIAVKIANTPRSTVGTTMATILGPWTKKSKNVNHLN